MPLFYQPDILSNHLTEEDTRHAVKVLRLTEGDKIELTDGKGNFHVAQLTTDAKKGAFKILESKSIPKKKFSIHLAVAPTKNSDRAEWMVEKCTEIGIDKITFLLCDKSERKSINLERIQKVAISALKQSQQAWLPEVSGMVRFIDFISRSTEAQKFIAYIDLQNQTHLKQVAKPNDEILVLIGPEGDFSKEELDIATSNNFIKVSLGENRLRTETAVVVSCSILNSL